VCGGPTCRFSEPRSVDRAPGSDWPELFDAVGADADISVVEVDGRVAMAGDEADLVADLEAVGRARNAEPSVLVGGALVGGGGLVPHQRRARVEGERLEAGVDDGAVLREQLEEYFRKMQGNHLVLCPDVSISLHYEDLANNKHVSDVVIRSLYQMGSPPKWVYEDERREKIYFDGGSGTLSFEDNNNPDHGFYNIWKMRGVIPNSGR
jgi:hypothetical protein